MNSFEKYAHLYQNLYTIEAWFIWLSLWLQYIGYHICLLLGLTLVLLIFMFPFIVMYGLMRSVKIKIVKKKNKQKIINQLREEYKNTLHQFDKKSKKKKHK